MSKIKVKDLTKKGIKTLNKGIAQTKKINENIVKIKEKSEDTVQNDNDINEYGSEKLKLAYKKGINKAKNEVSKEGRKSLIKTKDNIQKTKTKIKELKNNHEIKKTSKNVIKNTKNTIKTSERIIKNTDKIKKESVKLSQRAIKVARETAEKTVKATKTVVKTTISSIKALIAGTKALISALVAAGSVALIVIIVICLIGLLLGSIFGIFFSGEKTNTNSLTMKEVIAECNQEFYDKIQTIQDQNLHDEYVFEGNMASWKDILIIYTLKQTNGSKTQEVVTIDNNKKQIVKQIFWDMNSISFEVRTEMVTNRGVNIEEMPKPVQKRVLHLNVTSKTAEQMLNIYHFSPAQMRQYSELSSSEYDSLWSGVLYGLKNTGDYMAWRQGGQSWSNIRIGNTTATIGDIGCLITSIAIQIQRSGANTTIVPFNPGTFVEALNSKGGFDEKGNLIYSKLSEVVPNFSFVGNINLKDKNKTDKLNLIKEYIDKGYYLTAEVLGATAGNQHWVAIIDIDDNSIKIVDPASDNTDLWSAYEWNKTTQFNYYKTK